MYGVNGMKILLILASIANLLVFGGCLYAHFRSKRDILAEDEADAKLAAKLGIGFSLILGNALFHATYDPARQPAEVIQAFRSGDEMTLAIVRPSPIPSDVARVPISYFPEGASGE